MLKLLPFAIATAVASGQLLANEQQNNSRFALAGYGDVKYEDSKLMDTSAFSARFVPIFLFSLSDKMHIEAETEISVDENGCVFRRTRSVILDNPITSIPATRS